MKTWKLFVVALVLGIVITGLTGLIETPGTALIGATWYGLPFSWLKYLVVGPQYSPWSVNPITNLIADIIIWTVVVFIVLFIATKLGKKK